MPQLQLDTSDQPGVMSLLSVIMIVSTFVGVLNNFTGLPVFFKQRALFYRERATNTYSSVVYGASLMLVELPWIAFNIMIFCCEFYWLVGLRSDAGLFFKFYLAFFLTSMIFASLGQALAAVMPSPQTAIQVQTGLVALFLLFAGVFIPGSKIPDGWQWFHTIDPVAHALRALASPQIECTVVESACPTINVVRVNHQHQNSSEKNVKLCPSVIMSCFQVPRGFWCMTIYPNASAAMPSSSVNIVTEQRRCVQLVRPRSYEFISIDVCLHSLHRVDRWCRSARMCMCKPSLTGVETTTGERLGIL